MFNFCRWCIRIINNVSHLEDARWMVWRWATCFRPIRLSYHHTAEPRAPSSNAILVHWVDGGSEVYEGQAGQNLSSISGTCMVSSVFKNHWSLIVTTKTIFQNLFDTELFNTKFSLRCASCPTLPYTVRTEWRMRKMYWRKSLSDGRVSLFNLIKFWTSIAPLHNAH